MRAIQATVRGRVQGVFFRVYTRDKANQLGLVGWVRNNRDGSVECFAQGAEGSIETFIRFLHKGSPSSRVDSVKVQVATPDTTLEEFQITY